MKNNSGKKKCCICGGYFYGPENNPAPVRERGVCCDSCNQHVVIPARLAAFFNGGKNSEIHRTMY